MSLYGIIDFQNLTLLEFLYSLGVLRFGYEGDVLGLLLDLLAEELLIEGVALLIVFAVRH